ncbi:MAG: hypothetical protein JWM14_2922 [Chitinophagaceae bacterium]|nr:hypothetical protein [Chitinophagaceae bacterium]
MIVVKEKQNMTEQWIWCILCACVGLCGWGVIRQLTLGIDVNQQSISTIYLVLLSAIPCLVLVYFYKNKLYTRYDQNGIKIKYFPFRSKTIPWSEVNKIELGHLDSFPYSISQSDTYSMVYKAEGRTVLKVETKSEKIVISTTKPEEIQRMVDTYCYR